MLTADMPTAPPPTPSLAVVSGIPHTPLQQASIIVLAKAEQPRKEALYGTVGSCAVIEKSKGVGLGAREKKRGRDLGVAIRYSAFEIFKFKSPSLTGGMPETKAYPEKYHGDDKYFQPEDIRGATIEMLQRPKHGSLSRPFSKNISEEITYNPDVGYLGTDEAVFLLNMGGYQIKLLVYFKVADVDFEKGVVPEIWDKYCPPPSLWKISSDATGKYQWGHTT